LCEMKSVVYKVITVLGRTVCLELKSLVESGFVANLLATSTGPVFLFMVMMPKPDWTCEDRSFSVRSGLATGLNRSRPVFHCLGHLSW
jgi:hypothetical protein